MIYTIKSYKLTNQNGYSHIHAKRAATANSARMRSGRARAQPPAFITLHCPLFLRVGADGGRRWHFSLYEAEEILATLSDVGVDLQTMLRANGY